MVRSCFADYKRRGLRKTGGDFISELIGLKLQQEHLDILNLDT
jgi:hypothetical protein